jgi:hypothetical protein
MSTVTIEVELAPFAELANQMNIDITGLTPQQIADKIGTSVESNKIQKGRFAMQDKLILQLSEGNHDAINVNSDYTIVITNV